MFLLDDAVSLRDTKSISNDDNPVRLGYAKHEVYDLLIIEELTWICVIKNALFGLCEFIAVPIKYLIVAHLQFVVYFY